MGEHDGKLAHFGLREAILVVVEVGVRADLVEAIHVNIEEISQVVVHVEDLGVLKHVLKMLSSIRLISFLPLWSESKMSTSELPMLA